MAAQSTPMSTAAFIAILLLILLIGNLKAQEGIGCAVKTCPPGQVRMNAVLSSNGDFRSGCDCQVPSLPKIGMPATPVVPIQPNPNPNLPAQSTTNRGTLHTETCDGSGVDCGCPTGHQGECKIICDGTSDACKDTLIQCNNDGFPCTVDCLAENACASGSLINGPLNGPLTVNCMGDKACEGDTEFNGQFGTDLVVTCEGPTSCKNGIFNFGSGASMVNCNGLPDACVGAVFQTTIPDAFIQCNGVQCPTDLPGSVTIPGGGVVIPPVPVPAVPTWAPTPTPTVEPTKCTGEGDCACIHGLAQPCAIECDGSPTACKNSVITCLAGQDCHIDCVSSESCSGDAVIFGPIGASLTVNCIGSKSCQGKAMIDGLSGVDMTVVCSGAEACKGSGVNFHFGSGIGSVFCSGTPDACVDTVFHVDASAVAFQCVGDHCAAEPVGFNNGGGPLPLAPGLRPGVQVVRPAQQVSVTRAPTPAPVLVTQPLPYPVGGGGTAVGNPNPLSPYCCRTRFLDFTLWKGVCWGHTSVLGCLSVANSKCLWDPSDCLPDPPVNNYGNACAFVDAACTTGQDCCSNNCIPGVGCT